MSDEEFENRARDLVRAAMQGRGRITILEHVAAATKPLVGVNPPDGAMQLLDMTLLALAIFDDCQLIDGEPHGHA